MALSENDEKRKRQLGYLYANGIFDASFNKKLESAFPELKQVMNDVRKNERKIFALKYNMTMPNVALFFYRYGKLC